MSIEREHIESFELNLRGLSQANRVVYRAKAAELLIWVARRKFESKTRFEIRYSIPHEYGQFQGVGLIIQSDMSHDDRWHILSKLEDPEWYAAIGAYIAYRGEVQ